MTRARELAELAAAYDSGGLSNMKNRIINGAMVIDQRNAGASVTPAVGGTGTYTLDRWNGFASQSSKFTVQQNAGSVTPPAGFINYAGITSSSAYSINSTDIFLFRQSVEGFNCADLGWGTANAQTVTLSFWVRSSLTGTFGGVFINANQNRNYPFTYTISAANTWEQKSITVPGDTSGTWLKNNGIGIDVYFGLGVGSVYSGTAGAWAGSAIYSATGATSVVGTNGATWYITGVQLEKGSTATSFDYRPYGTELQLCQRYFQSYTYGAGVIVTVGTTFSTSAGAFAFNFIVPFRATPSTITIPAIATSGANRWCPLTAAGGFPGTVGTATVNQSTLNHFRLDFSGFTGVYTGGGVAVSLYSNGEGLSYMTASAEL